MSERLHAALHDKHKALEAVFGDVAGWEMPLSYRGVLEEAAAVRGRAGLFDFSHAGRFRIRGHGALGLLERVCTHDVAHQEDDTAAPTLLLNDRGGILDAARLLRMEEDWLLTVSPMNRRKVLVHLGSMAEEMDAKVDDRTEKDSMLLIVGPAAAGLLDPLLTDIMSEPVSKLPPGAVRSGSYLLARYVVARTDELGLWTVEVMLPNLFAPQAWRYITEKAGDRCIAPAGLAAWDVLRVEAGVPVYGHEINETFDPYLAGLGGRVDLGHDFLGAGACRTLAARPPARKRVGIVLEAGEALSAGESPTRQAAESETRRRNNGGLPTVLIPRQGSTLLDSDGIDIGAVTSGTFSPALDRPIAMAYVAASSALPHLPVELVQDGTRLPARIVDLPFAIASGIR